MKKVIFSILVIIAFGFFNCNNKVKKISDNYKILSLGDGYTKGYGVCNTCSFPIQLQQRIQNHFKDTVAIDLKTIAGTRLKTNNLLSKLAFSEVKKDYDFVTLLIGFNNQFEKTSFELYKKEFSMLVSKSIFYAKGNSKHVVVLSIPDYSYTPYGQINVVDSEDIEKYNDFMEKYCKENGVNFLDVSDIAEQGIDNPKLVGSSGLHLSELAYEKFVDRLFPLFLEVQ